MTSFKTWLYFSPPDQLSPPLHPIQPLLRTVLNRSVTLTISKPLTCTRKSGFVREQITRELPFCAGFLFVFCFCLFCPLFREIMWHMQKMVDCIQTDIMHFWIFWWYIMHIFLYSLFWETNVSYILVMFTKSMVDWKCKQIGKGLPLPTYLSTNLYSEAVLNANSAPSVYCCATCWCGVVLHLSMQQEVPLGCIPILRKQLLPLSPSLHNFRIWPCV